jgi:radical SAM protein with 4Fe4S-binding SPASM domain
MMTPKLLCLEITRECNLRCRQCHVWKMTDPEGTLSTEEHVRLVEEMASLSPDATITLSGGEPMLKGDRFFAITSACQAQGLACKVNTNGTFLDAANVGRLLREGPSTLSISLDSHRTEVHDWMRRKSGTFDAAVHGIRQLVAHRNGGRPMRIQISAILSDINIGKIQDYVAFAMDLGVDGVMFQVLAPTFANSSNKDTFFEEHFPRDPQVWDAAMDTIRRLQSEGAPIVTTADDLNEAREMTIRKREGRLPEFTETQICDSGHRNLMVDQNGDVMLCFFMRSLTSGRPLGNVRNSALRNMWESDFAVEMRAVMNACRKMCGMLNCHRRKSAIVS